MAVPREDITRTLDFPITENKSKLSGIQNTGVASLRMSLILYSEMHGQFPQSLNGLINSGFPIFYPRDVKSGNPQRIVSSKPLLNEQSFGALKYIRTDSNNVQIKYVVHDSGEDIWKLKTLDISNTPVLPDFLSAESGTFIRVNGGTVGVGSIEDNNKRLLYSQFGLWSTYLQDHTGRYYSYQKEFPSSFDDLFDARHLVIKENLETFQALLKSANADFKWGFDYNANVNYTWLAIDDEVLIDECIGYTENLTPIINDCDPEEIDMSSPLLTTESLLELQIPDDYLISINDISIGD